MRRRAYLALCGVPLSLVAGCIGGRPPGPTGTPREGETPGPGSPTPAIGDAAVVGGRQLRVADARLAESVFLDHGEFTSLERGDGRQFVVADVAWVDGGGDLDGVTFALVVDGETHRPGFRPQLVRGRNTVGLRTPGAPASEASIRITPAGRASGEGEGEPVAWRLGAELVGAFDAVPAFAVRHATVRVTGDGAVLALDVENAGDRDGTFRALVAPADAHDVDRPVAFEVPRGERVVHEVPLSPVGDPETVQLTTDWSPGTRRFEYGHP